MDTIISYLYIDDYLPSFGEEDAARSHVVGLTEMLKGGFHHTRWTSNTPESQNSSQNAKTENPSVGWITHTSRAHSEGTTDAGTDELVFQLNILDRQATHGGILNPSPVCTILLGSSRRGCFPERRCYNDYSKRKLVGITPLIPKITYLGKSFWPVLEDLGHEIPRMPAPGRREAQR